MGKAIAYLLFVSTVYLVVLIVPQLCPMPKLAPISLVLNCAIIGGLGGCIYCLRAVYFNVAVFKRWSPEWEVWYYIRPLVSAGIGAVSFIFLKAGFLILESGLDTEESKFGFYAFAFIAGFNVDNFIKQMEDKADAIWGIKKSRAGSDNETKKPKRKQK